MLNLEQGMDQGATNLEANWLRTQNAVQLFDVLRLLLPSDKIQNAPTHHKDT